jgi:type IV secretion system protein VirB10
MPAVLESAIDSTRPGAVRAIISRDIMGFDGTRILIPRGSRLIGEYSADIKSGQNRAHVVWTRLMRPDAVIINLDSPAADPLGRTGVKGEVNTHFFARFGSAILQSVLDLGVGVGTQAATRAATNNTMVVAVSPTLQPKVSDQSTQVSPTLTVEQGTSLSVFVAHDLDFSTVDN